MSLRTKLQSMGSSRTKDDLSKSNIESSVKQYQGAGPIKRVKDVEFSSSGHGSTKQKRSTTKSAVLRPFKFSDFPPEIRNIVYHQMIEDVPTLKVRNLTHDHFGPPVTRSSARKIASGARNTTAPQIYGVFAFLCTSKQFKEEFEPFLLTLPVLIELGTAYLKNKINEAYDEIKHDQATAAIRKIAEHDDIHMNFNKMLNEKCSYSSEATDQMKGLLDVLSVEVPEERLIAKLPRVAIMMDLDGLKGTRSESLVVAIESLDIFIPSLNIGFALKDTMSPARPRGNWRVQVHMAYDRLTDSPAFVTVQDDAEDIWRKTGICKQILMRR